MTIVRMTIATALVALAALLFASGAWAGAPGELDPGFGVGGKAQPPFGPEAGAGGVAVQPDGRILVSGSSEASAGFSVARLLPNGSPDPSWGGGDGVVTTPLGEFAGALDVAVQPDGKVVAVGQAMGAKNEDFAIVRYLANGELDPGFGEGGIVILPVGELGDTARAVAIGPGGRIAVTGTSDRPSFGLGAGVAVLESDGTPEAAFAEDGTTVIETESGFDDRGEGIAVQSDGRIVTAGYQSLIASYRPVVSRYLANFETPPVPGPKADLLPRSRIKGVHRKVHQDALKGFHGTASDPDGTVGKVQVALVRLPSGGKAGTSTVVKPRKWRTAKGTAKWALKLKHPLAPGRYVVFSRAIDDQGMAETAFSRRDGNRRAFRVLVKAP